MVNTRRRVGLLTKSLKREDTRIGYFPVKVKTHEAHILNSPSYSWSRTLQARQEDEKSAPILRGYRNLASARLRAPEGAVVIAEVLISGVFDEYEDGFLFREYRLLQLVVTHCEECKRPTEFYVQEDTNHSELTFLCGGHSSVGRAIRPVADVVAFFNPDEYSFDVRRLDKISLVPVISKLGVPFTSALGPHRWVPTRPAHHPKGEQRIASRLDFEVGAKSARETRFGYDDGSVKVTLPKELPATMKPLLDPSEELFKLREQSSVDRKRIEDMLKALRWKDEIIKKREEELRSLGVRVDEGEKSWQEGKEIS